jgi:hypothetical protein
MARYADFVSDNRGREQSNGMAVTVESEEIFPVDFFAAVLPPAAA